MTAQYPPTPQSVDVGGQRLTVPATAHEQRVIEDVTEQFGDQMREAAAARGVDLLAFVVPKYRRVVTPAELERRSFGGLGLD